MLRKIQYRLESILKITPSAVTVQMTFDECLPTFRFLNNMVLPV